MEETEQGWLKKTEVIHFCHGVTAPTLRDRDPGRRITALTETSPSRFYITNVFLQRLMPRMALFYISNNGGYELA